MYKRVRAFVSAAVVIGALGAASVAVTPSTAEAQTTFEDARGPMWALFGLETGFGAGLAVGIAAAAGCRGLACIGDAFLAALLAVSTGVVAATTLGIVGAAADLAPDVPFVFHHSLMGLMMGMGAGAPLTAELDSFWVSAISGLTVAAGLGTYLTVRRDLWIRTPEATLSAHMMTWVPIGVSVATGVIASALEASGPTTLALVAAASAVVYLACIVAAEVNAPDASAAPAPLRTIEPTPSPLFSWSWAL